MILSQHHDARVFLTFAMNGRVVAGNFDLPVDDPDKAFCDQEEVDYILEGIKNIYPEIELEPEHIVSRYCGVRPLPAIGEDHDVSSDDIEFIALNEHVRKIL